MSSLVSMLKASLQQQFDPVAFLERQERPGRRIWGPAWIARGGAALVGLSLVGIVSLLSGRGGIEFALTVLALMTLQMMVALPIMITHQAQFWFLYVYSPPMVAAAVWCGLSPLLPAWAAASAFGLFAFLAGKLTADSCTVWVYKRLKEAERDRQRRRDGGPPADLPALPLYQQARLARLVLSILAAATTVWLFAGTAEALVGVVVLPALLAGCLSLEATLLAWSGYSSLAYFDRGQERWRAAYCGRSAMVMPLKRISQAVSQRRTPAEGAAILLALLGQGYLGPAVRRAAGQLPVDFMAQIAFQLSLHPGGAAALRYVQPGLARSLRPWLACWAALAAEASQPLDLQRWPRLLTEHLPADEAPISAGDVQLRQVLAASREALLAYTYNPAAIEQAINPLQSLMAFFRLPPSEGSEVDRHSLTWPAALLLHLQSHRRRLLST